MHIAILALSSEFAERARDGFAPDRHRFTVAPNWSEIAASLETDRPGLVVVERPALARASLAEVAGLGRRCSLRARRSRL